MEEKGVITKQECPLLQNGSVKKKPPKNDNQQTFLGKNQM